MAPSANDVLASFVRAFAFIMRSRFEGDSIRFAADSPVCTSARRGTVEERPWIGELQAQRHQLAWIRDVPSIFFEASLCTQGWATRGLTG